METKEKDLNYWKNNAEEDYIKTPISVLRYISELEKVVNKTVLLPDVSNRRELLIAFMDWINTEPLCLDHNPTTEDRVDFFLKSN